ncbi:hypothetical protein H257_10913 [Aphanomyces astaci]|uniref:Myosin motor domain-containing protein n=2 Tax=Aphanomyces astaci TaxID=112090 RepID=W4G578_APHAT|nr:hypothetical protein H257_10913 [Aphanomyces astaci]ETV74877.1 hypothetical protein H257_10913 [Aphanomyces astaci]|eukprot:XP_009835964.1 hypothetical protein H257_10913 [Aphanomyces astaci]
MMFMRRSTSSLSSTGSSPAQQSMLDADIVREGWLRKKGHLFATIKSRYFVLYADGHLVYLNDVKKKKQKGSVVLAMSDIVAPHPTKKNDKLFGFDLKKAATSSDLNATKPYTLTMFALTSVERSEWIDAIRRVTTMQYPSMVMPQRMLSLAETSSTTDPSSSSTVLAASSSRDTFCVLIELGELQQLVALAHTTWDEDPLKWRHDQYLELCRSIVFTHEKALGANMNVHDSQVLQQALALRYQYEDAQAQVQARRLSLAVPPGPIAESVISTTPPSTPTTDIAPKPLPLKVARYFNTLDASFVATSPRSKTMAKYHQLYQQEALTAKRAWNINRDPSDDILNCTEGAPSSPWTPEKLATLLHDRFDRDRIYTDVGDTLIAINPAPRLVHHAAGNSIYDEATAMWYRDHDPTACSPHPFALAKRTLASVQNNKQDECIVMLGESGSGKTDLAKQVLKYIALVQQAVKPPQVQLFTSSTKSTIKMRSDESHLMDLLRLKHVNYETIYLDITPDRWPEMLASSGGIKQLPQLHMNSHYFGNYDELQRLEDDEQFVFYVKNPNAARLTSVLLDGNELLEAFGNAKTVHNPNSSRFGKSTSFSIHATTGHLLGGSIQPFFLETSRVTSLNPDDANFHIFYALLVGASDAVVEDCQLKHTTPATFAYLGKPSKLASTNVRTSTTQDDRVRWDRVLRCLDLVGVSEGERSAMFRVLSAVLYLGNIGFEDTLNELGVATGVRIQNDSELHIVADLLSIQANDVVRVLCTKQLSVTKKDEVYELQVHARQARITRESFARLLYDSLFSALVSLLNRSSRVPKDNLVHDITLVDVFGFEDVGTNSFEQLCINYLTEKLSAFELEYAGEVQGALYFAEGLGRYWSSVLNISEGVGLQVMSSPVGVWACLDEATVLHGNEDDPKQLKNSRFVRALYSRNADHPGLTVRKDPLEFTVNHHRSSVTYNATDFVLKNSQDFLQPLLHLMATSSNPFIQSLQTHQRSVVNQETKRQSSAARFKGHVQAIVDKLNVVQPRFVHCLRPRASTSKDFTALDMGVLKAQVQGQLLAPIVTYSSQMFRHAVAFPAFQSSYHMLFRQATWDADGVDQALEAFVSSLPLGTSCEYAVGTTTVFFNEALFMALLAQRLDVRSAACIRIQATVRMWLAAREVASLQLTTQNYIRQITQFYAQHNPSKLAEVSSIVRTFRGREGVLFEKLKQKYTSTQVQSADDDTSLESFVLKVQFDGPTVHKMLSNPKMALLLGEPNILQALRELSIDPSVIYLQTTDPVLRLFYTELRAFITPKPHPDRIPYPDMPLDDAVLVPDSVTDGLFKRWPGCSFFIPHRTWRLKIKQLSERLLWTPCCLPFHIDMPGVQSMLQRLIQDIEHNPSTLVAEAAAAASQPVALQVPTPLDVPPRLHNQLPQEQNPIVPVAQPTTVAIDEPVDTSSESSTSSPVQAVVGIEIGQAAAADAATSSSRTRSPATSMDVLETPIVQFQDMPLEIAVEKLIQAKLLCPTADMTLDDQAIVLEIASDPTMLAFHIDQPNVQVLLRRLCRLVDDIMAKSSPQLPVVDVPADISPTKSPRLSENTPGTVEFQRVKVTKKLMKKLLQNDVVMSMMGEPKVVDFFEDFSEAKSSMPTISFPAHETQLIAFYKAVLQLSLS